MFPKDAVMFFQTRKCKNAAEEIEKKIPVRYLRRSEKLEGPGLHSYDFLCEQYS